MAAGAGTALLNIFSVATGALGILQFGMDNFKEPEAVGSVVQVQVGLDYEGGLDNSGGQYVILFHGLSYLK